MKKIYLSLQVGLEGMLLAKIISNKLIHHNYKVTWIGTDRGIENKLIQDPNINMHHIDSTGIRGKSLFQIINGIINLLKSFYQSLILIYQEKPKFIIGFGGYVTVPVSIAAFIMRVPVYAHEANSVAGTSNKINNLISKVTFQTFPNTFHKNKKLYYQAIQLMSVFLISHNQKLNIKVREKYLIFLSLEAVKDLSFFNESVLNVLIDSQQV